MLATGICVIKPRRKQIGWQNQSIQMKPPALKSLVLPETEMDRGLGVVR